MSDKIQVRDTSVVQAFAQSVSESSHDCNFVDEKVMDAFRCAEDACGAAIDRYENEIQEISTRIEQCEDDDVRAELKERLALARQKLEVARSKQRMCAESAKSYEENALEMQRTFQSKASILGRALTEFLQALDQASG